MLSEESQGAVKKEEKKMLYTIAAVHLKKKPSSEKHPFKSLSFPDFTHSSCDNSLTDATDTELEIFRAVEP